MNDLEIIAKFFKVRLEFAVQANISSLLERATKPITVEFLNDAADQLRDTLLLAPAYESAWQEYVFYNPDRKNLAERSLFIEKMRQKEILSAEKHEYNLLVKELGREDLRGIIPLEDLREIAAIERENKRRKSLSVPELRELALKERPLPTRGTLPQTWFGADISTPVALRTLAKKNIESFRALCDRYGMNEVNNFLGFQPRPQPGYTVSVKT